MVHTYLDSLIIIQIGFKGYVQFGFVLVGVLLKTILWFVNGEH